jgi:hypothetical protein
MYYVACDISGRLSDDERSLKDVQNWMDEKNPNNGDCVVWEKPSQRLAAIRTDNKWIEL